MKSMLLCSVACVFASAAIAQNAPSTPATGQPTTASPSVSPGATTRAATSSAAAAEATDVNEIIVTATKRRQALSDVPIAVSAVTAQQLQNSGATDIRQLNQISPSLLVSSTSSEAGGGVARIRGIGTVGDNPGLESSVAVFIDGVYRNRSGVGLTELGELDRIEVLRGPQGTLFGRNASAGLINIITAMPSFEVGGTAEATYGNYNFYRIAGGITGPVLGDKIAARIDGVYVKRDGFLRDVVSGRDVNNRDRYLIRGQLLIKPSSDFTIRLIGDYSKRKEECCAATYQPFNGTRKAADGSIQYFTSPIATLENALGAQINDRTYARRVSISPGRNFRSDVVDWGGSAQVDWDLGGVKLTSISAYRDWHLLRGQDADFNKLDILYRDGWDQRFSTISQELRLNGRLFNNRLDWLVGGYYANEKLNLADNLKYGADYDRYANAVVRLSIPSFPGYAALSPFTSGFLQSRGIPAAAANAVAAQVANLPALAGTGVIRDKYRQESTNFAVFTHNVLNITDRLSLTVGARYTNETKDLNASLVDNNAACASLRASLGRLAQFNGTPLQPVAAGATGLLTSLAALPCVIPTLPGNAAVLKDRKKEDRVTGTVVLSWKPIDRLLTYASYSKGYKAGGFNLDRSALNSLNPNPAALRFQPELVDSYEVGLKLDLRQFKVNVAGFYALFDQFQLNTFNGVTFEVTNISSCGQSLNGGDRDFNYGATATTPAVTNAAATGRCPGRTNAGVRSQGVEVEASLFPTDNLSANLGFTLADTKYRNNLTGFGGAPLAPTLFLLPGQRVSNASLYTMTGSLGWNPELGLAGLRFLAYTDFRYQSKISTGSDLFPEKDQQGVFTLNARLGLQGRDRVWSLEVWAQNLTNQDYQQVGFNAPLQGSGTVAQVARAPAGAVTQTTLFGVFPAEPRTFGITARTRF